MLLGGIERQVLCTSRDFAYFTDRFPWSRSSGYFCSVLFFEFESLQLYWMSGVALDDAMLRYAFSTFVILTTGYALPRLADSYVVRSR